MAKLVIESGRREIKNGDYFLVTILGKTVLRQIVLSNKGKYYVIDPIEGKSVAMVEDAESVEGAIREYSGVNGQVELVEVDELKVRKTGVKFHGGGK